MLLKSCIFACELPLKEIEVMKAYFIAILTLFVQLRRPLQMSELENRIDSLLNGKKATVGMPAVWTDKDMLGITTMYTSLAQCIQIPCGTGRTGQDG